MGAPGAPKTGGRKKGTPNKKSQDLFEKASDLGVDPFLVLLMFAKGDWKGLGYESKSKTEWTASGIEYEVDTISPEMRLKAAADACQYLYPKRKAIEVTDTPDVNVNVKYVSEWGSGLERDVNPDEDT